MKKIKPTFSNSKIFSGGVHVNFSKLFENNLSDYEDFDLSGKRTYSNNQDLIIKSLNSTIKLDEDSEIITNYLMVMHKIIKQRFKTPESFVDSVATEILKDWFVANVKEWVEKEYTSKCKSLNREAAEFVKRHDPSVVFTDDHSILLYQLSYLFRFVIPLCTHFIKVYSDMISMQDTSEFYIDAYGQTYKNAQDAMIHGQKLFNKTTFLLTVCQVCIWALTKDTPSMNIYGKLNHYITMMVKGTGYSDAEMWNKLIMRSTSKYNQVDIIMAKVLIDIIPKASFAKNIIAYIITTCESHLKWSFHMDFNINYNMINPISEDSDFSDADRFDINSVKTDELKKILQDNFMDDTIDIIFERKQFVVDPDEYSWYLKNNRVQPIQEIMIRNFFSIPFGGYGNLDGVNETQYTKLLCYLIHYLKSNAQFKVLPKILTGVIATVNEKRLLSRPIERRIRESSRYQNIVSKYRFTGNVLQKSNVIEQTIMTILNSKILYNEWKYRKNGTDIQLLVEDVCEEYLMFLENL